MKKLICLIAVMLLAVNASATVWVGGDTAVAPAGGDGTSWGDVGNWVEGEEANWNLSDGTYALEAAPTTPTMTTAAALPSASNDAFILGQRVDGGYGWWEPFGPAQIDPAFSAAPATLSGSATVGKTWVGYKDYSGTLNVSSTGTLNTSQLVLGFLAKNAGASLNNQGTIASTGDMWVGWAAASGISAVNSGDITVGGNLNMAMAALNSGDDGAMTNTGTLDIAGNIDMNLSAGSSWLNVYGGTVEAAGLVFDDYYQDGVDITEGVLILDGDWTGQVVWNPVTGQPDLSQSFGLAWWTTAVGFDTGDEDPTNDRWVTLMTAYDGAGTIMYDYNTINPGQTTIWAVPEPATMMLLGLGAVLLRRKK